MSAILAWVQLHGAVVFGVLFAVSEGLDMIPSVQASSVWKLVKNVLVWVKEHVFPSAKPLL